LSPDSFIRNRAPIKDGIIEVPKGFGLDLDWEMVANYRLDH